MPYILIVDDDVDFAGAVSRVLTKNGYEVEMVHDTMEGLKSLQKRKPDLAILDVMFPENPAAGFELAREIRRHSSLKRLPLLMLTAVNQEFPLGFSSKDIDDDWMPVKDFVEKPVDFDVLLTKVEKMIQGDE